MSKSFTLDEIRWALNAACDDISDAAELPDEGVIDALNLLINATVHYLESPDGRSLERAVEASYDRASLDDITDWIGRA